MNRLFKQFDEQIKNITAEKTIFHFGLIWDRRMNCLKRAKLKNQVLKQNKQNKSIRVNNCFFILDRSGTEL